MTSTARKKPITPKNHFMVNFFNSNDLKYISMARFCGKQMEQLFFNI